MKIFLYTILLTIIPAMSFAQDTIFVKSYGELGYNYGEKVIQTADTGYIILGNKTGFVGNTDVYILKTDYCGNYLWDKAYGGTEVDWAEDIVSTKDKGYAIAGYMTIPSHNNNYNVMLIKTDSMGTLQWIKHYGGSDWDMGHSLVETTDSGFIIAGETYSFGNGNNDVLIMKTDKNGDSLWSKAYGGVNENVAYDISACHDGNFIVAGKTNSFGKGGYDIYLLKIKPSGDTLWTKTYGDTLDDFGYAAIETYDHGIVITGSTRNFNAMGLDCILLKTDSVGNQIWPQPQVYGGTDDEVAFDIIQNYNHGFMLAGYTTTYGAGSEDFYMVITDPGGNFIVGRTYGGSSNDYAHACISTLDSGYAVIGTTESMGIGISNILFLKTDNTAHTNASTYVHITDVKENEDTGFFSFYPNPVTGKLTIISPKNDMIKALSVYNQLGQLIYQYSEVATSNATIDFHNHPDGLYILVLQMTRGVKSEKILHTNK